MSVVKVAVGTNLIQARIHEFGGEIVPRRAPRLVFYIEGVGWRTSQRVVIPPRPYLRPALDEGRDEVVQVVGRVAGSLIEAAARG